MKINPKKQRIHRRVRNPLPVTRTLSRVEPTGTCKECMMRPRKPSSSRCEKCTQEYKLKN